MSAKLVVKAKYLKGLVQPHFRSPTAVKAKYLRGLVPPTLPTLKLAHQVAELHGAARHYQARSAVRGEGTHLNQHPVNRQLDRHPKSKRHARIHTARRTR